MSTYSSPRGPAPQSPFAMTRPAARQVGARRSPETHKADIDGPVGRLRRGDVAGRKRWSARSANYMLYLCSAVLGDQMAQGNAVRNVARLVDRLAGEAGVMRTLTEKNMFAILDHECRDRLGRATKTASSCTDTVLSVGLEPTLCGFKSAASANWAMGPRLIVKIELSVAEPRLVHETRAETRT